MTTTFINDHHLTLVKDGLTFINKNLTASPRAKGNEVKAFASKIQDVILNEGNPLEKFYFIHLLCQICASEKPNKVDKMLKIVLPQAPNAQTMGLISDVISFALCHPSLNGAILDNLSSYLHVNDFLKIDIESWNQANTLALDSPTFCSALLSRADLDLMDIDKKLISKWLQDLSKVEQEFPPVNISHLIRNSLLKKHPLSPLVETSQQKKEKATGSLSAEDSDLHFSILTLIQSRRCQTLTNQFLIEMANLLAKEANQLEAGSSDRSMLLDRFGQILSVAAACKVSTITTSLKNALKALDSNLLIAGIIKWQNK